MPARANEDAPSQDTDLEELGQIQVESIYSASKYQQKVTQAAASASIVTRDEIQRFGHRNVADVLRSIRGFNVSYDRNYAYVGLRGFLRPGDYTTRVLVLINGHRMNDNIYDSGTLGPDAFIDVDMIERVEVVRGPGSVMYGSNAFFGVVNIVTRSGAKIDGAEVSGEVASFNTYKGRFTYGGQFKNGVELALSGTYFSSEGDDSIYFPEFGDTAFNADAERARFLFGSISYHGFTLEGNYYWRDKDVPTASFGTIFNGGEHTKDARSYVELRYDSPAESEWAVQAALSYDDYYYNGYYPYDYGIGAPVINRDKLLGQWISPEFNVRREFFDQLTLMAGADARINVTQHRINYDEDPYVANWDDSKLRHNYGIFAQADWAIRENLHFVAGLSYDYFEDVGGSLVPRAGVIWEPVKNTTLKALYGEAFRAPNHYEIGWAQVYGATTLEPEKVRTYELVAEQYFLKNYRASVSLYRFDVEDMISQIPGATPDDFTFANEEGTTTGMGVETEIEARFSSGLLARASYALQRAEDSAGFEISNSPKHLVKAGLIVPLWNEKIFSGVEMQYTGSARTIMGGKASDFVILNWNLFARELLPGLEVTAGIHNLLDQRYAYPGAADHVQAVIPQDGRTFRAKLTYRF